MNTTQNTHSTQSDITPLLDLDFDAYEDWEENYYLMFSKTDKN